MLRGEGKEEAALRRPGVPQHRGRRAERVELSEEPEGLLPGRPGGRRLLHPGGRLRTFTIHSSLSAPLLSWG